MRILLDHSVPARLGRAFPHDEVRTAARLGWQTLRNGELLARAAESFDAFVTCDQNIAFQQDVPAFPIRLVVIDTTAWPVINADPGRVVEAVATCLPGAVAVARYPRPRLKRRPFPQPTAPTPSWHPDSLADRMPFLRRRGLLVRGVRAFFEGRGYTEVETPCAVPVPGEEVHLRAWATRRHGTDGAPTDLWLQTSPEFAMKRLLVAGAGPIFQLARVWRDWEGGRTHLGEFTMLEWYRPGLELAGLMDEVEALLRAVLPPGLVAGGFERVTVAEAFRRWVGADVLATEGDAAGLARAAGVELREDEAWEDLFFRLLLERVEPRLGRERPSFLTHWPASQAALARRDPADGRVALRFELFLGGMELANAFEELTDPDEQAARFRADRARRESLYGPGWGTDEDFLAALRHGMPAASGIAMGFDRLAMLASGARRISDVLWLP